MIKKMMAVIGIMSLMVIPLSAENIRIVKKPVNPIMNKTMSWSVTCSDTYKKVFIKLANNKQIEMKKKEGQWVKKVMIENNNYQEGINTVTFIFMNQNKTSVNVPYDFNIVSADENRTFDIDQSSKQIKRNNETDLNIEIEELNIKIDKLEDEKSRLMNKIKQTENELRRQKRAAITNKDKELEQMKKIKELKLKAKKIDALLFLAEEKISVINKKEAELIKQNKEQDEMKKLIIEKEASLVEKELDLKKTKHILERKSKGLNQEEKKLNFIKVDILKQKEEIRKEKEKMAITKEKIERKTKTIKEKKLKLEEEQSEIVLEKKNIEKSKNEIKKIKEKIENEEKELQKQIAKSNLNNLKISKELQKQRNEIQKTKDVLAKKEELANQRENIVEKKEKEMEKESKLLEKEKERNYKLNESLSKKKIHLTYKEEALDYKINVYLRMRNMLNKDINRLEKSYLKGNQKNWELLNKIEKKAISLNNITKRAEYRSNYISNNYNSIKKQNMQLRRKLSELQKVKYEYGIMPFLGYVSAEEINESCFGVKGYFFLNQKLFFDFSLSNIKTLIQQNPLNKKIEKDVFSDININYFLNSLDTLKFFIGTGVIQAPFSKKSQLSISTGVQFEISDGQFFSRFEAQKSKELIVRFGIANSFKKVISNETFTNELLKEVPHSDIQIIIKRPRFDTYKKEVVKLPKKLKKEHWAYLDFMNLGNLNYLPASFYTNNFNPNQAINNNEIDYLIKQIKEDKNKQSDYPIEYEIIGNYDNYNLTISILDQDGNKIRKLKETTELFPGKEKIIWNQKDDNNKIVKAGNYIVEMRCVPKNRNNAEKIFRQNIILKKNKKETYQEVEKNDVRSETRIEYIIKIAKLIQEKNPNINLNLTIPKYTDWSSLNIREQKYIWIYAHYLDKTSFISKDIYPRRLITCAEAIVIANRYLNWKRKQSITNF
ncbi:MAG: hypothetical protein VW378_01375 [bacterium]